MKKIIGFVVLLLLSSSVSAGLPANCGDRLKSKVMGYLANLEEQIAKPLKNAKNKANLIAARKNELERYISGSWVQQCIAEHATAQQILNSLQANEIASAYAKADSAGGALCEQAGDKVLMELVNNIKSAVQAGDIDLVERSFNILDTHNALQNCPPLQPKVAQLNAQRAGVLAQVGQVAIMKSLSADFARVFGIHEDVTSALAAKTALNNLTGAQSQSDYRRQSASCLEKSESLSAAGFNPGNPVLIFRGEKTSLKTVMDFCKTAASGANDLIAKAEVYNKEYNQQARAKWEQENVIGEAMKKVFLAENKIIPRVKDLGAQIVWHYKSILTRAIFAECIEYSFDSTGNKLLDRKVWECDW